MIRKWMMVLAIAAMTMTGCKSPTPPPTPREKPRPEPPVEPQAAPDPAAEGEAQEGQDVVLKIGETEITQAELDQQLERVPAFQRANARDRVVKQLVTRAMYFEFVRANDLMVDEAEYDQAAAREREKFEEAMAREREAFKAFLENLRPAMSINAYIKEAVSDERAKAYMADHPGYFDGTKVKVSHLLIKCPTWASTEEQKAARRKLQGIVEQVNNRELTFAEAAKQFSDCSSAEKGGDLGEIEFGGSMDTYFTIQAFETPEGQMSDVFRTSDGWHVLLVTDVERGDGTPKPSESPHGSKIKPESLARRALRAVVENEVQMAALDAIPVENNLPPLPEPSRPPVAAPTTAPATTDKADTADQ